MHAGGSVFELARTERTVLSPAGVRRRWGQSLGAALGLQAAAESDAAFTPCDGMGPNLYGTQYFRVLGIFKRSGHGQGFKSQGHACLGHFVMSLPIHCGTCIFRPIASAIGIDFDRRFPNVPDYMKRRSEIAKEFGFSVRLVPIDRYYQFYISA